MWGGEEKTDSKILEPGTILYHYSYDPIKYFQSMGIPESTCFFVDERGNKDYNCYQVKILKRIKVGCYGYEEVRFDPSKGKCEICQIKVDGIPCEPKKIQIID